MAEHERYLLRVTAGPSYDLSTHRLVPVNTSTPIEFSSSALSAASINIRIQDYRGLPIDSPRTSPYFSHATHRSDRYSIAFSFVPNKALNGNDVVFGNDFDHPIKDGLPPGFDFALRIAKWVVDPGLDGDVYAEKPYLYGPLLSSINVLRFGGRGGKTEDAHMEGEERSGAEMDGEEVAVLEEGAMQGGSQHRQGLGVPADAGQRKKWFLNEQHRKAFEFEEGRMYQCDFFNPYLDFNGERGSAMREVWRPG